MLIGITGSIASGKSVVSRILEILGYKVFNADTEAKYLYSNVDVCNAINEATKFKLVDYDEPDYVAIADFLFKSVDNNRLITSILYPFLEKRINVWINDNHSDKLLFVEAALLFESGWREVVDFTICVSADEKTRYDRLKTRNPNNYENCISRSHYQLPDETKCKLADFVIINDGCTAVIPQIQHILKQII